MKDLTTITLIQKFRKQMLPILLIILLSTTFSIGQNLKVMTYNIRYATPQDGENQWALRKHYLAQQIKYHAPDVFGIQEGLLKQVNFLDSAFADFDFVGTGRDDGKTGGEYSAIYFNAKKFDLKHSGQFWLSETPEVPGMGWDAAFKRVCTYVHLTEPSTSKDFWVFNTHFDHLGETARINSVKLIIRKIAELTNSETPVVFMGDLNLEPNTEGIHELSKRFKDTFNHTLAPPFGPNGTFNGFEFCKPITQRIDYIFVNENWIVEKYAVLSDSYDMKFPSDHLPVIVNLKMKQ